MAKTNYLYAGLRFTTRDALEKYLMVMENKTYEEARTISSHAPKENIPSQPKPKRAKKMAKVGK